MKRFHPGNFTAATAAVRHVDNRCDGTAFCQMPQPFTGDASPRGGSKQSVLAKIAYTVMTSIPMKLPDRPVFLTVQAGMTEIGIIATAPRQNRQVHQMRAKKKADKNQNWKICVMRTTGTSPNNQSNGLFSMS